MFHFRVLPTSWLTSIVYFEILIMVVFEAGVLYPSTSLGCAKAVWNVTTAPESELGHTDSEKCYALLTPAPLFQCPHSVQPFPAHPTSSRSLWFLLYPFCISSEKLKGDVYFLKSLFFFFCYRYSWALFFYVTVCPENEQYILKYGEKYLIFSISLILCTIT